MLAGKSDVPVPGGGFFAFTLDKNKMLKKI